MGLNNDGLGGVDVEQIALEKTIIVGTQAPNTFPCIKLDDNGKSLPKMEIAKSGGTQIVTTAGYDCGYIDTSWLSHGGIFTLSAGNKVNISSGGGGFEWITSGPSKINTCYQDFLCTHAFNVNTRLFKVASTERTHLMGTRIDIQYEEIYCMGNANFTNNVHINGGLFVNGELYCTHMTTMGQDNFTSPCGTTKGFLNPGQSFVMFNGASMAAKKLNLNPIAQGTSELPNRPGYIDCVIALPLPSPIGLIEVPAKILFSNGVSLMSDALYTIKPEAETIIMNADQREIGAGINKADFTMPGHQHHYKTPAFQPLKNTGDTYSEAADAIMSNKPAKAKPTNPNGSSSIDQVPQMLMDATQNSVKEYMKQMWDDINPFKKIPWI